VSERSQIALLVLRICVEHVKRILGWRPVVDHPQAATLPAPGRAQRTLRSPPPPRMTGPCSGRSMSAIWRLRWSSSLTSRSITFVKIGVSTKRIIDYTPMADNRQAGRPQVREPSSTTCGNFFVAKLWTNSAHDYAEACVNMRVSASDLFRRRLPLTPFRSNEVRPPPWLVRNAEVGSFEPPAVHQIP
jgi:hypothetical protein